MPIPIKKFITDKEPVQIFGLERAAIAQRLRTMINSPEDCLSGKQVNEVNWPRGRASEDRKFVANLTQSVMNFLVGIGITTL